jgi:biotin carboxyl carrier protein
MAATKKTETKKTEETKKAPAVKAAAKPAAKVKAAAKPAAKKAAPVKKAAPTKKAAEVIIQSPMGGNITPDEILAKVGKADKIYVRVDENKAYWVRGKETGSVDLWD